MAVASLCAAAPANAAPSPAASPPVAPPIAAAPPATEDTPLGALPPQTLSAGACGLFLWRAGEGAAPPSLVLAATSDPPRARILLRGWTLDLPRVASGDETTGRRHARYEAQGVAVTLDLAVAPDPVDPRAARIPEGTLTLDRRGGDSAVLPVAGMIGCEKE